MNRLVALPIIFVSAVVFGLFYSVTNSRIDLSGSEWNVYASPSGRLSFEYPALLQINKRPRNTTDDPIAFTIGHPVYPDATLGMTCLIHEWTEPFDNYCQDMVLIASDESNAITSLESVTVGGASGYRREFMETDGGASHCLLAIALAADNTYFVLTVECPAEQRESLQSARDRILGSIRFHPRNHT